MDKKLKFKFNLLAKPKGDYTVDLYNHERYWAFNTAKYRALMSGDPVVIKHWYRFEVAAYEPDSWLLGEIKRSFYYGDNYDNAEEFFGIIPMVIIAIRRLVNDNGFNFGLNVKNDIKEMLLDIYDENKFQTEILNEVIDDCIGVGSPALHVFYNPKTSDKPIIEYIPTENLIIKKKHGRIVEIGTSQQVVIDGDVKDYELHTIYSKRRTLGKIPNGLIKYVDDGIFQEYKVWGSDKKYVGKDSTFKKKVFEEYGITEEKSILPLSDFPIIYFPCPLGKSNGVNGRPYGLIFGLEEPSAALDETLSNCVDTIRKAFPFLLIDSQMIPSDLRGDKNLGAFSTRRHNFVTPENVTTPEKLLQFVKAELNTGEYVDSATFQINIILNKAGINAATMGLQLTRQVESESTQNAKERNSIRTRNTLCSFFEERIAQLNNILLQFVEYINGNYMMKTKDSDEADIVINDYKNSISVKFDRYIVDTPETLVDIMATKIAGGLMSTYMAVREYHEKDGWTDEDCMKETNAIYAERGIPIAIQEESESNKKKNDDSK